MDWLIQLDGGALLWIQEFVRSDLLTPIVSFYTKLGDAGLMWIVLSLGMLFFKKTRKAGAAGILALILGALCTNVVLKHLVARPRPWLTVEGLFHLVVENDPNSFPSGHTMASFACAGVFWHYRRDFGRWSVVLVILAALIGFSRLYLYVHFPTDVLCGALLGLVFAALAVHLCDRAGAYRMQKSR